MDRVQKFDDSWRQYKDFNDTNEDTYSLIENNEDVCHYFQQFGFGKNVLVKVSLGAFQF